MLEDNHSNSVALVIGGHVNGYSIIRELYNQDIKNIALFDPGKSIARYSNKIKYLSTIDNTAESLLTEINKLHQLYDYIVLYPTNDIQLENILSIKKDIQSFCYIPFNSENLMRCLDKSYQYKVCDEIGIPYPKTFSLEVLEDLDNISNLIFPLIVKPTTRKDLTIDVFRNLYLESKSDLLSHEEQLKSLITAGVTFIVSEYIPGDDTNIYAYTCFRSNDGQILNSWTGKKLTQYPDNYGVFSSSSNEAPDVVKKQGEDLVNALNAYGIIEPEFKYDSRDNKFKLMEVNLRSMMWNHTGYASGVSLQKTQYDYATNKPITQYLQDKSKIVHYVLMLHEVPNLISRPGYWKHFKHNVFGGDNRVWAVFDPKDAKPFLYGLNLLSRAGIMTCLKRLKLK